MPRAYTGSQYSAPVPDASAFAINSADDTKQVRVALGGLAPNTTAVITVTGNGTFPDPGTGGVVIGAAVTGGVAGRVLFEGAGPVVADSAALTFNSSTGALSATSFVGANLALSGGAALNNNQNAFTQVSVTNANAGANALAGTTFTDGTNVLIMRYVGAGAGSSVTGTAKSGLIYSDGGSLRLVSDGGGDIQMYIGSQTLGLSISNVGAATIPGLLKVNGVLNLGVFTVGTLPNAGTSGQGATAFVTDSLAPAFGVAVANGGAAKVPVYSDGAAWIVG